ncbi:UDP-N-acetylglucosamine 1-carboxyvinyltransferase, partial [Okeania hirsuta]
MKEERAINQLSNSKENPKSSPINQSILKICGPSHLKGNINISGAKNSALAAMAGTLLCSGTCR